MNHRITIDNPRRINAGSPHARDIEYLRVRASPVEGCIHTRCQTDLKTAATGVFKIIRPRHGMNHPNPGNPLEESPDPMVPHDFQTTHGETPAVRPLPPVQAIASPIDAPWYHGKNRPARWYSFLRETIKTGSMTRAADSGYRRANAAVESQISLQWRHRDLFVMAYRQPVFTA